MKLFYFHCNFQPH